MANEIVPYNPNEEGVVIYRTDDNTLQLDVQVADETVWLTQQQMAELFQKDRTVITRHINNIFSEGELEEKSNVHFLHFPFSDKPTKVYNLDVIISVGYRVKSQRGTQFRQGLRQETIRYYAYGLESGDSIKRSEINHQQVIGELKKATKLVTKLKRNKILNEAFRIRQPWLAN